MYQNLQQKYQTSESKLLSDASLLLRGNRVWLNRPSIIYTFLYTKTRSKIKIYRSRPKPKSRHKARVCHQQKQRTKLTQVNQNHERLCRPRRPTNKCSIWNYTRINCHGITKAYPWASGCPSFPPTT